MITPYTTYVVRFELPDGVHLATHRTVKRPKNEEGTKELLQDITRAIAQNPDAKIDYNSIKAVKNLQEVIDMAEAIRKEDPNRPLASDLGLDATNRLLTNPEIARSIAAANGVQEERGQIGI